MRRVAKNRLGEHCAETAPDNNEAGAKADYEAAPRLDIYRTKNPKPPNTGLYRQTVTHCGQITSIYMAFTIRDGYRYRRFTDKAGPFTTDYRL